jgi:hypothetical protein
MAGRVPGAAVAGGGSVSGARERLSTALGGRYRIDKALGAGGMATVFLAQDLKHDRKVAIKVLKPELAAVLGAERFVVEIKTTAALSHPHILPLFDSGEAGGFLYYVMPYIAGETIRDRLNRETQLSVDEALRIATEVADALDYAHRHGVIHRDIKPENILLHDGRPMVMDFGIALAVSAAAGGRMTETGLSLGTPHYMSPEQATADKDITARSDVYSLASVLYEMLTGNPPHTGSSAQQVIMKIITETPAEITTLRKAVPANVAAATARALEKLPADRFDSAKAFADALANPVFTTAAAALRGVDGVRRGRDRRVAVLGSALAVMTLVTGWSMTRPEPLRPVSRYHVALPDSVVRGGTFARLALSPDGSKLFFATGGVGPGGLWVRDRDQLGATLIPGTENAIAPFVSPDGERVAILGVGFLRVVSLRGGPPITLADTLVGSAGGTWSVDGNIYADGTGMAPLVRVPASGGGGPERFTRLDSATGEVDHLFPDALPNGRGVIFTVGYAGSTGNPLRRQIAVASTKDGTHRILFGGVYARYARSGHVVYVTADGSLMAAPFDQDRMEVTGESVGLASGMTLRLIGVPDLALAGDGTLAYTVGGGSLGGGEPVWVGRDGLAVAVAPNWTRSATTVALSPDGSQMAVGIATGTEIHLWTRSLTLGTASRLTFGGSINYRPVWMPDGKSLVYVSDERGPRDLLGRRADGTAAATVLVGGVDMQEAEVTRDGQWLVYRTGGGSSGNLYARRFTGDTTPIELATTAFGEYSPSVSPDGRWLAHSATETARSDVYIRPFPDVSGGKWLVSSTGGSEPRWSRDGRELFYRNGAGQMVAVEVHRERVPPLGNQRVLFDATPFTADPLHQMYDVTPDGRRFLMTRLGDAGSGSETQVIVVQNFFEELKRRVPP